MAYTATTGDDMIYLGKVFNSMSQPGGGTFTVDGLAGSDTLCLWGDSTGAYDTNKGFNFTITSNTYDAATTLWTISGASAGRSVYTFKLTNVEFFKLHSASTPVAPPAAPVVPNDTTPPAYASATVSGKSLVITYTDANNLDATHTALPSNFLVTGNTVSSVIVSGKTVTLGLGTTVAPGSSVTFSYTHTTEASVTTTNAAIQDAAGNDAANIASTTITASTDAIAPQLVTTAATTSLSIASDIAISFDETITLDATVGTVTLHAGTVTPTTLAATVTATASATGSDNVLTIHPDTPLAYGTQYFVTFGTVTPVASSGGSGEDNHHSSGTTYTYTYGDSAVTDTAGNHLYMSGSAATTTPATYSFTTIADPFVAHNSTVVDSGPVLVGAGGAGILAWMFFI